MLIRCTFTQEHKLFTPGCLYRVRVIKRCGIDFTEVIAKTGFPFTLQPCDNDIHVSVFSGSRLLADFEEIYQ